MRDRYDSNSSTCFESRLSPGALITRTCRGPRLNFAYALELHRGQSQNQSDRQAFKRHNGSLP